MNLEYFLPLFLVTMLATVVFSFVSVVVFISHRRREREAYYRSETLKKLAEMQGTGAQAVLEVMRDEERKTMRMMREGLKIAGLVATAVGLGLLALFYSIDRARPIGLIPLFVGVAFLIYAFFLVPKDNAR